MRRLVATARARTHTVFDLGAHMHSGSGSRCNTLSIWCGHLWRGGGGSYALKLKSGDANHFITSYSCSKSRALGCGFHVFALVNLFVYAVLYSTILTTLFVDFTTWSTGTVYTDTTWYAWGGLQLTFAAIFGALLAFGRLPISITTLFKPVVQNVGSERETGHELLDEVYRRAHAKQMTFLVSAAALQGVLSIALSTENDWVSYTFDVVFVILYVFMSIALNILTAVSSVSAV